MHPRRFAISMLLAGVTVIAAVAPVGAARPATPASIPASTAPKTNGERALTAAEQAASAAKIAAAEAYLSQRRSTGVGLVALACVPNIAPPGATAGIGPKAAKPPAIAASCAPPSGFLSVEARQQLFDHYCGPAAGQVISNYAWAMKAGANKFSQDKIADWMKTDINGQTSAPELATGLEKATAGSPRRKAGFRWAITDLNDTDHDGTTGDQLHGYLMSAISGSKMPVAIAVKPHEPGSSDFLSSWPNPVRSAGHWIAAYGWRGVWNGTTSARTYFADSSRNQGGGTGKYWDPTAEIARMIGAHTGRIVW